MIRSMTGFGQAAAESATFRVSVELRSVNHRFADLRLRVPAGFAGCEPGLRKAILARIARGRIEGTVNVIPTAAGCARTRLDRGFLEEVLAATKTLGEEYGIEGRPDVRTILAIPGMFRTSGADGEPDADTLAALARAFEGAIDALEEERRREGRHLAAELLARIGAIGVAVAEIRGIAAELPSTLRARLVARLEALAPELGIDAGRVAQEAVFLADRADITEELVRLEGHVEQVQALLGTPDGEAVGKPLEFLSQEILRETNTINSKSADLRVSRASLSIKSELEKVREQIQNVE